MHIKKMKKLLCFALVFGLIFSYGMFAYADIDAARDAAVYHVATTGSNTAGIGSESSPWATPAYALTQMAGGDTLLIHAGTYERFTVPQRLSGPAKDQMTVIKASGDGEVIIDGGGSSSNVVELVNVGNLKVDGLTIRNCQGYGLRLLTEKTAAALAYAAETCGFDRLTDDPADSPFANVHITNNKVYNVNTRSIALMIQAENYMAPVSGLLIDGNEVYFCRTDWSEALTINGNVNGFEVCNNVVHNNNNLGIVMIGFESTARIPTATASNSNLYPDPAGTPRGPTGTDRYNMSRNGKCHDNLVYASSTINNANYWDEGSSSTVNGIQFRRSYDPSCGGIYVDGGQDIEIYNNIIWDCNLGIEVATEAADSQGYYARGMKVHDNLIVSNRGWAGLVFGGYDNTRGYTEYSEFTNNVIFGNLDTNIEVSRSRNNLVEGNVIVGTGVGFEATAYRSANNFGYNVWYNTSNPNNFPGGVSNLPADQQAKQIRALANPLKNAAAGDFSFVESAIAGTTVDLSGYGFGFGADLDAWVVDSGVFDLYKDYLGAVSEMNSALSFMHGTSSSRKTFNFDDAYDTGNLRDYLTAQLKAAGYENSEVLYILQTSRNNGTDYAMDGSDSSGATNGIVNRMLPYGGNNAVMAVYPGENNLAAANGNINTVLYDQAYDSLAAGTSTNYAYLVQVVTWYGDTTFTQEVAAIRMNMAKAPEYHVATTGSDTAGNGSAASPWATVTYALSRMNGGDTLLIHGGTYVGRYTVPARLSGPKKNRLTVIKGAGDGEAILDGNGSGTVVQINNVGNFKFEGLTVRNATTDGIMYNSSGTSVGNFNIETDDPADSPFANVYLLNNKVYNINTQEFAIGIYGGSYAAPISNLVIAGNEVFFNRTHYSEGVTINGNIDGFDVCNNLIHNNNNIGIAMIGFENTARGPTSWGGNGLEGRHRYDNARHGRCYNNVIYGSCVIDNEAYWFADGGNLGTRQGPAEGEYDRCCNGIYVDGGQHIEIFNNFVFDCDIGIEISTEHNHPAFWIADMYVHDNIVASNVGWNGISLGGQSMSDDFSNPYGNGIMGQTRDSRVENNILYGNVVNINIQHTQNNTIKNNIIMGGGAATMDWLDESLHSANNIEENLWYNDPGFGVSDEDFYREMNRIAAPQLAKQVKLTSAPLADPRSGDFTVTYGSGNFGTDPHNWKGVDWEGKPYQFDASYLELYADFITASDEMNAAVKYLENVAWPLDLDAAAGNGNLRTYLTGVLHGAGFENSSVPYILKVWTPRGNRVDGWQSSRNNNNFNSDPYGVVNMYNPNAGNNLMPGNNLAANNGLISSSTLATRVAESKYGYAEYKYLVMVVTEFDGGHSYTQGETRGGVVLTAGVPPVFASIATDPVSGIEGDVEFTLSISQAKDVLNLELEFVIDGSMLAFIDIEPINGFTVIDGIAWKSFGGDLWKGTVTLGYPSGSSTGFNTWPYEDIARLIFAPRATGEAALELTSFKAVGLDGDVTSYIKSAIANGKATTKIDKLVYSKYDLNRDGVVDALDLGIMLLYCGFDKDSPNWGTLVKVNDSKGAGVTAQMCDVNGDGVIDMLDLLDLFIHYTK
ncbi:MAG: right-handed parallel beta-helix repeat-containing protein [Clostridiales bacterium]|nr:right-handed parallel beta-helix repeat-containing protein [Clostridiales bacterium]